MTKVDTVPDPAMLGAWLRRVTTNTALMRLRKRRNEPMADPLDPDDGEFTPTGSRARPVSSWPPLPEDALLRRETCQLLEAAVSRLPDGAREVYVLAEIEDLPREEVAELLGISRDVVRVRLHRARTGLRQELEHYFTDRHIITLPRHGDAEANEPKEGQPR